MEVAEWQKWLNEQRERSTVIVEEISLRDVQPPWGMQTDGTYRREPPAFFNIKGVKVQANREVPAWTQPILEELGVGYVLVGAKREDTLLLTARQEPGNPPEKNYVLLGPTIQASKSNLFQRHGGRRPPYAQLLDKYDIAVNELPQDGGRFLSKRNKYGILEIPTQEEIELLANSRWFRRDEISHAYRLGDANEHLSQVLLLKYL